MRPAIVRLTATVAAVFAVDRDDPFEWKTELTGGIQPDGWQIDDAQPRTGRHDRSNESEGQRCRCQTCAGQYAAADQPALDEQFGQFFGYRQRAFMRQQHWRHAITESDQLG